MLFAGFATVKSEQAEYIKLPRTFKLTKTDH